MNNFKQILNSVITLAIKAFVAVYLIQHAIVWAGTAYDFGYRVFTEEPISSAPGITYSVTITEETTPKQLSEALEEEGLIRDSKLFYVQYLVSEHKDKLQPGQYDLNTAMTAEEMLSVMAPDVEEESES